MKLPLICLAITLSLQSINLSAQQNNIQITSPEESSGIMDIRRDIKFKNDSKSEEILVKIHDNVKRFRLQIKSMVDKGKLYVEIFDPSNTKHGEFTIETQVSPGKDEKVNGRFQKELIEPGKGDWKIKISPTSATGEINIRADIMQ